jgi:hypothetical protein
MTGHWLFLMLPGGGYPIDVDFVCYEPVGAPCRQACSRDACEEGCVCRSLGVEPVMTEYTECLPITALEEGGTWEEQYNGPETRVRCGPIDITWNGDCYEWRYSE